MSTWECKDADGHPLIFEVETNYIVRAHGQQTRTFKSPIEAVMQLQLSMVGSQLTAEQLRKDALKQNKQKD